MAYSKPLARRVSQLLEARAPHDDRRMFGGIAFMVGGHMAVGVIEDRLMVRVGKEGWQEAMAQPGTREMDFTGRSMKSMVFVEPEVLVDDESLRHWIERGVSYVEGLEPKV